MLVANDFFLIAHDHVRGKPLLAETALGLGLAGALIGELVLLDRISVDGGGITILDVRPPQDPVAHTVLAHLVQEQQTTTALRDWLRYLGHDARQRVGGRLVRDGYLWERRSRRLWRETVVYEPVDLNTTGFPVVRLRSRLTRRQPLSLPDTMLAGLLAATGLDGHVLHDATTQTGGFLRNLVRHLPRSMREVVATTEVVVGDAILSHRRRL